jgi:hypothetical protein
VTSALARMAMVSFEAWTRSVPASKGAPAMHLGFATRVVALHYCSSILYYIHEENQYVFF